MIPDMEAPAETLDFVRHRLEVLVRARLAGDLDLRSEAEYRRLCAREKALLAAEASARASEADYALFVGQ
jgi:hypothetical protein